MSIEGLVAKDENGRIVIEYLDIARFDLSALMTRAFDKLLKPVEHPDNVIPFKEKQDE